MFPKPRLFSSSTSMASCLTPLLDLPNHLVRCQMGLHCSQHRRGVMQSAENRVQSKSKRLLLRKGELPGSKLPTRRFFVLL
ncbi:hypothetical protein CsSME_00016041 [Camellia sinensis var. sinensis]